MCIHVCGGSRLFPTALMSHTDSQIQHGVGRVDWVLLCLMVSTTSWWLWTEQSNNRGPHKVLRTKHTLPFLEPVRLGRGSAELESTPSGEAGGLSLPAPQPGAPHCPCFPQWLGMFLWEEVSHVFTNVRKMQGQPQCSVNRGQEGCWSWSQSHSDGHRKPCSWKLLRKHESPPEPEAWSNANY